MDGVLAAGLVLSGLGEAYLEFERAPWNLSAVAFLMASAVALFWRRRAPVPVAMLAAVGLAAPAWFGPTTETLTSSAIVMVAAYSVVVYSRTWHSWPVVFAVLVAAGTVRSAADYGFDAFSVISSLFWLGTAFGAGVIVRHLRGRAATSEKRAEIAERAREEHAATAVAAERLRIARDLHDVVAHAISVIVLQARGGRRMLDVDPGESRTAFDTIEGTAEQAMAEMRRLLGVIRAAAGNEPAELAPRPGLRSLDALAEQVHGPHVTVRVTGDVAALPSSVDLAAYRIVQEALTNVLRHAAARSVDVSVAVTASAVDVAVDDDGRGGLPGDDGFGILGMRERAARYGGTFSAGPRDCGGFAVRASLPLVPVPA
jgi:signal transduction histidine kinase